MCQLSKCVVAPDYMLYSPLTQTSDKQGAVTRSAFTFSLPAVAKHLFITTETCFVYTQDLDERLNVLISGVSLLCREHFFLVFVGLP